jgi:protein ImuB
VDDFAGRGLKVRLALADTIGAAWAVAHYQGRAPAEPVAPSIVLIPPGQTAVALGPLPIEALRLAEATVELLHPLGIRQIGQLETLPRTELAARFGSQLAQRWDQALGRQSEPLPAYGLPPRFLAEWTPEYATARRETIAAALEHLIGRLAAMLARCGRGALRLQCRLAFSGQAAAEIAVGLFQATARPGHLFQLAELQLERLRLPAPVEAIAVEATATALLEYHQKELFPEGAARWDPRPLAGLVERLSSRLGVGAVTRPHLRPEAQPELACRYEATLGGKYPAHSVCRRNNGTRSVPDTLPPRPLRLLTRPVGLAVMSIVPDGPPLQWLRDGRQQAIAHCWGPERIETGWWRGGMVGRDYYQVETACGNRFWLFRRLSDGRWFLHGTFD